MSKIVKHQPFSPVGNKRTRRRQFGRGVTRIKKEMTPTLWRMQSKGPGEIDHAAINRFLDLSNDAYPAIMEKNRRLEETRASKKALARRQRSIWQRIVDVLIPVEARG